MYKTFSKLTNKAKRMTSIVDFQQISLIALGGIDTENWP